MNIAIIGRTETLYHTAKLLMRQGHCVKLIVTAKEAPEYEKTAADFESLALEMGAKYLLTSNISTKKAIEEIELVQNLELGISMNYVNVISQEVVDLFPYGILNAHGGDLPRYRGNACQAWAILNGEDKIGLCIHKMVGGELDSGDIIAKDYYNLHLGVRIGDVQKWMGQRIPEIFAGAVRELEKNKDYILEKQSSDPARILRCYPRNPEDGEIDWSQSNENVLRLINASSEPYSGAFCQYKGERMIIWEAELYEDDENYCAVPGQVAAVDKQTGSVVVIAGKGKIKINRIEYGNWRGIPGRVIKSIRGRLK
jgi:methionyl-tRNA formyltransferase